MCRIQGLTVSVTFEGRYGDRFSKCLNIDNKGYSFYTIFLLKVRDNVMANKGRFLGGLVLGAIVGVVAGALIPAEKVDKVKGKVSTLADEHDDMIQTVKAKTATIVNKTLFAVEQGCEKVAQMVADPADRDDDDIKYSGNA